MLSVSSAFRGQGIGKIEIFRDRPRRPLGNSLAEQLVKALILEAVDEVIVKFSPHFELTCCLDRT